MDDGQTQFLGGGAVHAAWFAGQIQNKAAGRQSFQDLPSQDQGGDGVDHQVIAAQPAGQLLKVLSAKPGWPSQLLVLPGGYADSSAQGREALGGKPPTRPKPMTSTRAPWMVMGRCSMAS